MRRRLGLPAPCCLIEQLVAPDRGINLAPHGQLRQPLDLDPGKGAGRILPVLGQIADDPGDAILEQILQRDAFYRQPVHRPPSLKRQSQQAGGLDVLVSEFGAEQFGQPQPAADRIGGWWNLCPAAQRIEQRAQCLIQIKIANHCHPRQQHPATRKPHKCLGHDPLGAAVGQQQGQPGEAQILVGVAWDQPGDQRIGKAAVRGD